jgi:hypothetical protein
VAWLLYPKSMPYLPQHLLHLNRVSPGVGAAAAARPVGVEKLPARAVHPFVLVGAEVIALSLQEVGGETSRPVSVVEG